MRPELKLIREERSQTEIRILMNPYLCSWCSAMRARGHDRIRGGLVDKGRVSNVARGANEFIFAVPEPATIGLEGVFGASAVCPRRFKI
jgi:hypothetical protein